MNRPEVYPPHYYPVYKTVLILSLRDKSTNEEIYQDEIDRIAVLDKRRGIGVDAQVMIPDVPRSRKYWKASLPDVVPRVSLQIYGGALYKDLTMDLTINNRKRFVNVLVILERR